MAGITDLDRPNHIILSKENKNPEPQRISAHDTKLKAQSHTGRVVTGRGKQNERTMKEKHHTGRVESKMKTK